MSGGDGYFPIGSTRLDTPMTPAVDAMTPTEQLIAALAPLCPECYGNGWYAGTMTHDDGHGGVYPEQIQVECQHSEALERLTPEDRDKMLLGFAMAELPDSKWVLKSIAGSDWCYLSLYDDVGIADGAEGPTPLAAVEAARKGLCDGGVGPMVDAEGNVTDD